MAIWDEARKVKGVFIPWVYIFAGLGIFFFFFTFGKVNVLGHQIYMIYPSDRSIASEIFIMMQRDLVPVGVKLIVTEPTSAFTVQAGIAVAAAFILSFPILLWKAMSYVMEALYKRERKALIRVVVPSVALFTGGVIFGYKTILPLTFKVLYGYAGVVGAETFFTMQDFASFILLFSIGCGCMFLLPVVMAMLNSLGMTNRDMWRNNWRYAFVIFLIFSAIITPDGSGITMMLLSVPLTGLYFVGSIAGNKNGRKITSNKIRR